jgi:hypothetical protein
MTTPVNENAQVGTLPDTLQGTPEAMQPAMPKGLRAMPPVLRAFLAATGILWVVCIATELLCRFAFHLPFLPYDGPTSAANDHFADAYMFDIRFRHFHTPEFFDPKFGTPFMYPAPAAFFYAPFQVFPHPWRFFMIALGLVCLGLAFWLMKTLIRRGVDSRNAFQFAAGSLVFSYPIFFELDRGNIELYIWGMSALGILSIFRKRPWLAATLLAFAGACKGYPYLYLGLLFPLKHYLQIAYSIALGLLLNLFSLWFIADNFALGKLGIASGLARFHSLYMLVTRPDATGLDHSFFGFIKRFWTLSTDQMAHILPIYLGIAALIALAAYFFRVFRSPLTNQVIFLSIATITLMPTSYDYTLLHLYSGWVILVLVAFDAWRTQRMTPRGLWPAFVCYILLMSPQNEFILHGQRIEGQIKCVVLVALAIVSMIYPFAGTSRPTAEPQKILS